MFLRCSVATFQCTNSKITTNRSIDPRLHGTGLGRTLMCAGDDDDDSAATVITVLLLLQGDYLYHIMDT